VCGRAVVRDARPWLIIFAVLSAVLRSGFRDTDAKSSWTWLTYGSEEAGGIMRMFEWERLPYVYGDHWAGVKCEVRVCEVVKCEARCKVGCDWSVASGSPRTLPDGN